MKRIPANPTIRTPSDIRAPGHRGGRGCRRFARWTATLAAVAAVAALAGCAGFERDWRRALAAAPSGTGIARPGRTTVAEGAWTGTWTSTGTGHTGRLRCVVGGPDSGTAPENDDAPALRFAYHAKWAIFSGTFPTWQPVVREPDGSVRSVGEWVLPKWAGGRYSYDITIRGDRFSGTWSCAGDSGSFEMRRAGRSS